MERRQGAVGAWRGGGRGEIELGSKLPGGEDSSRFLGHGGGEIGPGKPEGGMGRDFGGVAEQGGQVAGLFSFR